MDADRAIADIAARQYSVFTSAQALAIGFTRKAIRVRVAQGRWADLHRGVHVMAGTPESWEQSVFAAVSAYGDRAVASATTAAAILDIIDIPPSAIHVTLPPGQHRKARAGVIVHQAALKRSDVRTESGIRLTAPNRTLVDCAALLSPKQLETAVDTALFRGLTSATALDRYIRERRLQHRPGIGRLRRMLLDRANGSSQSELERIFFRKLRKSHLPKPTRQYPVGKRFIDISFPKDQLIIELDGHSSRFTAAALRDDRRRQNEIMLALPGWTLLRFTWDDVVSRWPDVEANIRGVLDA